MWLLFAILNGLQLARVALLADVPFDATVSKQDQLDFSDKESAHDDDSLQSALCVFVNPDLDVLEWKRVTMGNLCTNTSLLSRVSDEEERRYLWGLQQYAYDVVVSDKVGPHRDIPDHRHELCHKVEYDVDELPAASVVIVYYQEALSVLIRMVESILLRTPPSLLHEILLLDDFSGSETTIEPQLRTYGAASAWGGLVKYHRNEERQGLIRSKIIGARLATGKVLVFLDSHCEVNQMWLEPLLSRIKGDRTRVALPVVDIVDPYKFEHEMAHVAKGGFDWSLRFAWEYMPHGYFYDHPMNNVLPIRSPAMSGGLLAIEKAYFHEIGEYDDQMNVWGAENIEMSLRVWMCGGSVEVVPCSRVGHVFRYMRPYHDPNNTDTASINTVRVALTWLDQFKVDFFSAASHMKHLVDETTDVSDRLDLRQRLNCRDFQWYIDNVYPELRNKLENVRSHLLTSTAENVPTPRLGDENIQNIQS